MKIDDLSTREAIARSVLENGPSTAVTLGERLGLTPAGIRRHLDLLVLDGILEAREPHQALSRGRGRPSKVFVMTDGGREKFEHSYDDLAVAALKFMSAQSGGQLVQAFAQSRADDIERKAVTFMAKKSQKNQALATFLTEQGYAASIESKPTGDQLCQHLGTHVQRLATIAHGDGVCTTYIPNTSRVTTKTKITQSTRTITAGKATK